MMKLLSAEWYAAEAANKKIRDTFREKFWSEVGFPERAEDIHEVDIPKEDKLKTIHALEQQVFDGREKDESLREVTKIASVLISQYAPGTLDIGVVNLSINMLGLSHKSMRAFFLTEEMTAYELSEIE